MKNAHVTPFLSSAIWSYYTRFPILCKNQPIQNYEMSLTHNFAQQLLRLWERGLSDWIYSLASSGALVFIMSYYIHGQFFKYFKFGAIQPIYIFNSLSLSFSVQYKEQNQAILLHEIRWQRMHVQISSKFFKVLQISLKPNMCYIF